MPNLRAVLPFGFLLLPACAGVPHPATGAPPSREELRAVVRVAIVDDEGFPRQLGSGTLIDSRGDVLTAFHVVGKIAVDSVRAGAGIPRFEVELSDSSRDKPSVRYRAHLREADAALDLAILHIDGSADGKPVTKPFPYLKIAEPSRTPDIGAGVVAIGFPGEFDTVQATRGGISGLSSNLAHHLSWLRTDAQFLPGMSGGALLDRDGALVGVPLQVFQPSAEAFQPTSFARPIERLPEDWLTSKREISPSDLVAPFALTAEHPIDDTLVGDPSVNGLQEERLLFTPPHVGGVIHVSPALAMEVVDGNAVVRDGLGEIEILADGPSAEWIHVSVPLAGAQPVHLHATFEPGAHARDPLPTTAIHLKVAEGRERSRNGHVTVAPIMLGDTWDLALDYAAGRVSEADLAPRGIFAHAYDGPEDLVFPGCVRGRRYKVHVVPREGKAYSTELFVDGVGNQYETMSW